MNDSAKGIGCRVLSDEFVMLNRISGERVVGKCGPLEEVSMLKYAHSRKHAVFIGHKGLTPPFNHNDETLMETLHTIKIENESDVRI